MQARAFTYILTNWKHTVLYTGVTNNLLRRVHDHKNKINKGFTSKYSATILVYYETHLTINDAIYREKAIKKKSRRGKIRLIETMNPTWLDLSSNF